MSLLRSLLDSGAARHVAQRLSPELRARLKTLLRRGETQTDRDVEPLRVQVERRLDEAAILHDRAWSAIESREDWERFRDARLGALRASLGSVTRSDSPVEANITGTHERDGVTVENLIFDGDRRSPVTANLYRRSSPGEAGAGILLCHSHHGDKSQLELQQMGLGWARSGSTVLVIDLVGHGERRRHPFRSAADYRLPFKAGRQDYYFRHNLGMQLQLAGDSLTGWMARDLMRAVDLLLQRRYVDRDRIVLIGSVAGGGDVAAVAAALDRRIGGLVAFGLRGDDLRGAGEPGDDFRGETIPGPGRGSWESTRNLPYSARDGFFPWVLLAACAPRKVVYAHEFAWNPEDDPRWARLRTVFGLYDASASLAAVRGRGSASGPLPMNTHCTNVGIVHRRGLDPILRRWFDIAPPDDSPPRPGNPEELACLAPEATPGGGTWKGSRRTERPPTKERLRVDLQKLLGTAPAGEPRVISQGRAGGGRELVHLHCGEGIDLRFTLRLPVPSSAPPPIVIGFCQHGREVLEKEKARLIDALVAGGAAVCLTDLRGTGPFTGLEQRGRHGMIASVAASELMLGRTLLGARLADLLAVSSYLRTRPDIDGTRVALLGESFAPANRRSFDPAVPYDAGPFPELSEPLGGLIALLGAVLDKHVRVVHAAGGLLSLASVPESPFCYLPADVVVPGFLQVADLTDLVAALAPRPVRIQGLVDGLNRPVDEAVLVSTYQPATDAYRKAGAADRLQVSSARSPEPNVAQWLLHGLGGG